MKLKFSYKHLVFLLCLVLIFSRFIIPPVNVLTWDVFGYYLYLPGKFIYKDIGLLNQDWLSHLIDKYKPTATLYQAFKLENGNWVIKYSMGLAILYAPFFFFAHLIAGPLGFPADGLSAPYQYSMTIGGLIFSVIGLMFFAKVLRYYFNNFVTCLLLILVFFGTNYFQLTAFDGTLLSHNFLFTLYAMLVYYTINWHDNPKFKYASIIGLLCGFIILIRPSEIVCVLIPLLWKIKGTESFSKKFSLVKQYFPHLIILLFCMFIVFIPQLIYWKSLTGSYFFYSYSNNSGEGFEFLAPYTFKFLFNFRKGWLIYTPVMIFSLIGFYYLFKQNRSIFYAVFVFFVADVYIISSWSCWWYAGGSYSSRSLVPAYIFLSLPLGYFIEKIITSGKIVKYSLGLVILFFVVLNLFQTWQFENGILSKERMTREYYFAIFGKIKVTGKDKKLLIVDRSLDTYDCFKDESEYSKKLLYKNDFNVNKNTDSVIDTNGAFIMNQNVQFSPGLNLKYKEITKHDHAWIRASAKVYITNGYQDILPLLVISFYHNNNAYKYRSIEIDKNKIKYNNWNDITSDYLTPEVLSEEDSLMIYLWHRGKEKIFVGEILVYAFEPKK